MLPSLDPDLFGGNSLAHRDSTEVEAGFARLVADLQVPFLRFPGGSVTESCFCSLDPDATTYADPVTGETRDMVSVAEFFALAEQTGVDVVLTLPTRVFLSEPSDANGPGSTRRFC